MIQQRLPNELLSSLATSLVQGRIFEIVRMLLEVQHATEKQLFHRRLQFQKRCQGTAACPYPNVQAKSNGDQIVLAAYLQTRDASLTVGTNVSSVRRRMTRKFCPCRVVSTWRRRGC